MRVERSDLSPTKVKIVIIADLADLEPIKQHVLAHFRHSVKVPGFRAGAAPMTLVEKNVDQRLFMDEFMEHTLNQLYVQAIKQENLRPVGQPNVNLKKFVPYSDLEMEVETEVIGQIILPDYKKIKLSKKTVSVTAKDIEEVVKSLQQRVAERKEVNKPAVSGDELIIDFKGKDKEGKSVAGTDAKDYPLILGSKAFIPGFEGKLVGAKTGQNKKFTIKFPKNYGVAALQNKDVTFEVDIKKVNQLKIPKADDIFAAKVGPFKSLSELKDDIKKQLKIERQSQADRDYENQLISEIVSKANVQIPSIMVDEDIARLEEEEKNGLLYRGQTWEEHLKEEGLTEKEHRERQRPRSEERIKAGIILGEISDKEGIIVSPQEIDDRIKLLKERYQDAQMQSDLDKPNARRDIEARLLTEKTIQKLVSFQ